MGAENSKSNAQRTREDNEARIDREVKRALEIQKQMYEQKCKELRQAQRLKDKNVINGNQVPNNNAVDQKGTSTPTATLYPSLSDTSNNNIQPAAYTKPSNSERQMLPNTLHCPVLPTAPLEEPAEVVFTTTARFKEQAHPGHNHKLNNRLEPQRHLANQPPAVPSTSSNNATPDGQNSTNARLVGQNSTNTKPVGQNFTNAMSVGQKCSNARLVGQNSTNDISVGKNSSNARLVGQNSTNDKSVGQNSSNARLVGQNSTNAMLVGQNSTKARLVGQKPQETRNGARKKASPSFVQCVTCSNELGPQIYQCKNGHSSCWDCRFDGARCGVCSERITDMRNIALETSIADLKLKEINEASLMKVKCPNSADGCRLSMKNNEIEDHLKECPYREMACPLAAIFGCCSWTGRITQIKAHFSEMHQEHYQADVDKEMYLLNINVNHKIVHLVNIGTFTFVVHIQVNVDNRAICMTVQTLGTKVSASKWSYELHVYNKREPRKKYKYTDTCVSSCESVNEIFRQQKCAVLNTEYAKNFLNNNQLTYKFYIKKDFHPNSNQHKRNTWKNSSE